MNDFSHRIHAEKGIDGFTVLDGTVKFYSFVRAALLKVEARRVLDFGAGRGAALVDDHSHFRRHMRDLRTTGAYVVACDVDDVVKSHPASHEQVVITPDKPLPFADSSFDAIVSDMTFEHIEDASFVAGELLRVVRAGGFICARTPNLFGYVSVLSRIVPNRHHQGALRSVQPSRKSQDVFPAFYRMNTVADIRRLFPQCRVYYFKDNAEPAYFFGSEVLYRLFLLLHWLLPTGFATTACFYIEKPVSK